MTAPRSIGVNDLYGIEVGIGRLKAARGALRKAGARNAADAVARAIKSAEGALHHARGTYEFRRLCAEAQKESQA